MLNDIFDTSFETDLFESLGNFELFSGSDQVNLLDSFSDEQTENEFETDPNQVSFERSQSIQNISKLNEEQEQEQEQELLRSVTVSQSLGFPNLFVHDQSDVVQRKRTYEKAAEEIKLEAQSEPLSKQQKITNSSLETHQNNNLKITSNSQTTSEKETKKNKTTKKTRSSKKKTTSTRKKQTKTKTKTTTRKRTNSKTKAKPKTNETTELKTNETTGLKAKKTTTALNPEERRKKNLERNRINARKSRQRKKQYVQGLETETKDLRSKNNELVDEVSKLSIENQSLRDEINQLRLLLQGNCKKIFEQSETNNTVETQENSETEDRNLMLGKQLLYGLAAAVFPMAQQLKK
ncbi:cyclic-amp response element binding protein [Anaeramoeba flamelloides]|uniref:Cyclic-amp response element binding protein n=1 Tax=Anaeramoeba flamelloides TaxID=1746091 RepID=A0ABQ8YF90_9EUKA|nr:cyclic-amp response element binding protein [Anaeramoeba flamelloides]